MPPIKFQVNLTYGLGADVVSRFSRLPPWRPSWILNITNLAILNLHVTSMPPIKFRLNLTYHLGAEWFEDLLQTTSWISEWNDFSNSESLCSSDASHQVSAQSS